MIKHKDQCVGCPSEMGCLGIACPYTNVEVRVCDECGDSAYYIIEGMDLCEQCAEEFLDKNFSEMSMPEKIECLGLDWKFVN